MRLPNLTSSGFATKYLLPFLSFIASPFASLNIFQKLHRAFKMKKQAQRIGESDLSATRNESVVPSPTAGHPDFPRSKELTPPIAVTVKQAARLLGTNDK